MLARAAVLALAIQPAFAAAPARPRVLVADFAGIISPVAAEFIVSGIDRARAEGDAAFVLQLDTPGGLDASMRQIVQAELASKIPVIVYVAPGGARAASAGVFIAMAANTAAMVPTSNIGAAHPILFGAAPSPMGGEGAQKKTPDILEGKIANDASAYLQSIAKERGRNVDWAAKAVTESSSIPASEAVKLNVVDLIAPTLDDLLGKKGLAGAAIEHMQMTRRQRLLAALCDPNVAMILMSLGGAGLLIELYNPGLILPGIVGLISLILAFYSFQTLSASLAGVFLILAGMIMFLLEIKITSYGLLALGGTTATLLGALMLFNNPESMGLRIDWSVLAGTIGGMLGVTALFSYLVYKAYRRKTVTGAEAMIGAEGVAITALDPSGRVRIHGELWDAVAMRPPIAQGASVTVEALDGLTLKVR